MPKPDPNFSIELATAGRAVDFYMPGEVVEGNVCRTVTEAQESINGLELRWYGRAHAAWVQHNAEKRDSVVGVHVAKHVGGHVGGHAHVGLDDLSVIQHGNDETYFDITQPLHFPSKIGKTTSTTLEKGAHRIPFSFVMPPGLPSSWKAPAEDIEIKYSVDASLSRQGSGPSVLTATLPILVWRPTDLNAFPLLAAPKVLSGSKTIGCCFCESGPIGFKINFPRMGWVVGETIDCTLQLFNGSSKNIRQIEAKLVESVEIRARDGMITYGGRLWACIKKFDLPGIAPGASETAKISMDLMPDNYHPLNLNGCSFMKTIREISVEMTIPGASNLSGSIPIGIGTICFRHRAPLEGAHQPQQSAAGPRQSLQPQQSRLRQESATGQPQQSRLRQESATGQPQQSRLRQESATGQPQQSRLRQESATGQQSHQEQQSRLLRQESAAGQESAEHEEQPRRRQKSKGGRKSHQI